MKNSREIPRFSQFSPPKLPIGWFCATFVVPLGVIVIPGIISSDGDFRFRIIVALIVLSALLFICCVILTLNIYSVSYENQMAHYKIDYLNEELEKLEHQMKDITHVQEQLVKYAENIEISEHLDRVK